jgi:guanyl-specific ribonuclease Sa
MRITSKWGLVFSGLLAALLIAWLQSGRFSSTTEGVPDSPSSQRGTDGEPHSSKRGSASQSLPEGVPDKVATVLDHIDSTHRAPDGYEGGRTFHNEGRGGEERLPLKDKGGNAISYQEWDVNPKVRNVNRGAERLVTGSDGSAYYTSDHYRTFTKIR